MASLRRLIILADYSVPDEVMAPDIERLIAESLVVLEQHLVDTLEERDIQDVEVKLSMSSKPANVWLAVFDHPRLGLLCMDCLAKDGGNPSSVSAMLPLAPEGVACSRCERTLIPASR